MAKIDIFAEQNHDMVDSLEGQKILIYGGNDTGKSIPINTGIPTPDGFREAWEIKEGDYLFGQDGKPTKVVGIYPQESRKKVWEVSFFDGRTAKCCEEHLWEVYDKKGKRYTKTLKELVQDEYNAYSIPLCEPVEYEEGNLPIPPYIMGLFIARGVFKNKKFGYDGTRRTDIGVICSEMGWTINEIDDNGVASFKKDGKVVVTSDLLSGLSMLDKRTEQTMLIPIIYTTASVQQRVSLLNGLLDANGKIDVDGGLSYTTFSPILKDRILSVCYSLGLLARCDECKIDTKCEYIIHIFVSLENYGKLLEIKGNRIGINKLFVKSRKRKIADKNYIMDIKECDDCVEMVCFKVDNNDHLYLMNDYIVTHNTFQSTRMEKPLLLMAESGGNARNVDKFPINTWDDFVSIVAQLTSQYEKAKEKYQTIIIDTSEELVSIVEDKVAKRFNCTEIGMVQGAEEGNPNGYQLARSMFRQQINLLTKYGYTVIFISHETVINDYEDPYSGKKITKIMPYGSNKEKGSTAFIKNLCDFVIYTKARGIDSETGQTIRSMAICKETSQIFARSRYTQMQPVIEDFTAENLKEAILTAIKKEAENEGAGLVPFKRKEEGFTKEDYFDMIKPYLTKLFKVNAEYVTSVITNNLGAGKKLTDATDEQIVELSTIYNDFVSYALERNIKI